MKTTEFISSIEHTYKIGVEIIKKKNADYAASDNPFRNFESASIVGVSVERAMLVRILDKLSRVSNLLEKEAAVVDESLEDTIVDAINYLAILKAHRESARVIPLDTSRLTASEMQLMREVLK